MSVLESSGIGDPLTNDNFDIQIRVRNADGTTTLRWMPITWLLDLVDTELAEAIKQIRPGEDLDAPTDD